MRHDRQDFLPITDTDPSLEIYTPLAGDILMAGEPPDIFRFISGPSGQSMLSFQGIPASLALGCAVIAYLAYRRLPRRHRLDLQGEVAKERDSLCSVVETLPALMELAKQSRITIADSQGLLGSEGMRQWLDELEVDAAEGKLLRSQVPAAGFEPADHSVMELEIRLVEILAWSIRANKLADKYRLSVSSDEADSKRLLDQSKRPAETPPALEPSMSLAAPS